MPTKDEVAKSKGLKVFDNALPQPWVDRMAERGFDVVPHFVWSYDEYPLGGVPYPITARGLLILGLLATAAA